jgi:MFS family permease
MVAGHAAPWHDTPAMSRTDEHQRQKSITRRYYLLWWFYAFGGGFIFGVYPLFLRSRGLSELQANSILATYFLITFLTDVPTGAFADALSRRRAFMLACLLRSAGFALYFFAHTYTLFVLGEAIDALGTTFANGAIDAWAVDALDGAGFHGPKDRIFSRAAQLNSSGWLCSAFVGAYIASHNIAWPWLFGAAGYLLSMMVGAALMAGEHRSVAPLAPGLIGEIGSRARAGMRAGFSNRSILLLTAASAAQTGAWAPYWMVWPQFFVDHLGFGVWVIGWLYCFFSIGRLAGAEFIARYQPSGNSRALLLSVLAFSSGSLLLAAGMAGAHLPVMLAMLFLMNFCSGATQPVATSWINEHLEAGTRATLLSFQSTFATLGGAIGLLACGWIADRRGLLAGWYLAGATGLIPAFFYFRLRSETGRMRGLSQTAAS